MAKAKFSAKKLQAYSLDELQKVYEEYLRTDRGLKETTVRTARATTFFLWRQDGKKLFWKVMLASSSDFDKLAKESLIQGLSKSSSVEVRSVISQYMVNCRRFRKFLSHFGVIPEDPYRVVQYSFGYAEQ